MSYICAEMASLAESILNLEKRGFHEDERLEELDNSKVPSIIYKSQICKVKISFNEWHPPHQSKEYNINFYYGRLNAPNSKMTTNWKNEECHCWHGVAKVLHFLDNATPEYTAKNLLSHDLIKEYSKLISFNSISHNLPEWEIRKQAYIWEKYIPQLFDLFDANRTDLWESYQLFLKNVYDIKGRPSFIKPSMDKVC
jgi:hypothetical protein